MAAHKTLKCSPLDMEIDDRRETIDKIENSVFLVFPNARAFGLERLENRHHLPAFSPRLYFQLKAVKMQGERLANLTREKSPKPDFVG